MGRHILYKFNIYSLISFLCSPFLMIPIVLPQIQRNSFCLDSMEHSFDIIVLNSNVLIKPRSSCLTRHLTWGYMSENRIIKEKKKTLINIYCLFLKDRKSIDEKKRDIVLFRFFSFGISLISNLLKMWGWAELVSFFLLNINI